MLSPELLLEVDDTTTPGITYIGEAPIGTATTSNGWRIKQIDTNSTTASKLFPRNTAGEASFNFGFIWANRASYTYARTNA